MMLRRAQDQEELEAGDEQGEEGQVEALRQLELSLNEDVPGVETAAQQAMREALARQYSSASHGTHRSSIGGGAAQGGAGLPARAGVLTPPGGKVRRCAISAVLAALSR